MDGINKLYDAWVFFLRPGISQDKHLEWAQENDIFVMIGWPTVTFFTKIDACLFLLSFGDDVEKSELRHIHYKPCHKLMEEQIIHEQSRKKSYH